MVDIIYRLMIMTIKLQFPLLFSSFSHSLPQTIPAIEPQPTTGFESSKEEILSQLGIPVHLADRTDCGLVIAYQKYKAQLQASQAYERMSQIKCC